VITQNILPGIVYYQGALFDHESLYTAILQEIRPELTQQSIVIRGRTIPMPRLTAWFGDSGAEYFYSGILNKPLPWTPALDALRHRLNRRLGTSLNSVLANYYIDGRKSIGWHSDNEAGLVDRIVSVSLGATRSFQLRAGWDTPVLHTLELHGGDVLTMTVASQRKYQHSVPKESTSTGARLNLTFRTVG
jgi:alkylated DNA repair dioxygenase AlkB